MTMEGPNKKNEDKEVLESCIKRCESLQKALELKSKPLALKSFAMLADRINDLYGREDIVNAMQEHKIGKVWLAKENTENADGIFMTEEEEAKQFDEDVASFRKFREDMLRKEEGSKNN